MAKLATKILSVSQQPMPLVSMIFDEDEMKAETFKSENYMWACKVKSYHAILFPDVSKEKCLSLLE